MIPVSYLNYFLSFTFYNIEIDLNSSMLDGLTDYCLQTSVEAQSKTLNISMQHLATLLDRVVACCEGAGQTHRTSYNIQKCFNKNLTIFKLDPTPSNISQRVVTGWKNMCNTLPSTM